MTLVADCSMCAPLKAPDHKLALLVVIISVNFCRRHRMKQNSSFLTNYAECYTLLITNSSKAHTCNILQFWFFLLPVVIMLSNNKGFHKHFVQFRSPEKLKYKWWCYFVEKLGWLCHLSSEMKNSGSPEWARSKAGCNIWITSLL